MQGFEEKADWQRARGASRCWPACFVTAIPITKQRAHMGRPPIGKRAMTAAERQRRRRRLFRDARPVTKQERATRAAIARATAPLQARIRELEGEIARLHCAMSTRPRRCAGRWKRCSGNSPRRARPQLEEPKRLAYFD